MDNSVLQVDLRDEATAVLTLNRPDKRNALNIELLNALTERIGVLEKDPSRRVLILRGAGPVFCAGLDLLEAADVGLAEQGAHCVANTLLAVAASPLITISAVHGASYAGGAGLMAACDFVVASDDLRVCFPEVRRGLVPALVSVVLRRRVSESALRELLLLAEPIGVERAASMGLVDRIVPVASLMDESHRIANLIQQGAPASIRLTKKLLDETSSCNVSRQLEQARKHHMQARHGDEAKEGLRAFREGRDPRWS